MEQTIRVEFETKLNKVCLHIYTQTDYKEDYQIPMLRQNKIEGILDVERCEVDNEGRYTYDISGLVSMKTKYEKNCIKRQDIQDLIQDLLRSVEALQKHMLNPDCLLLQPEYIFYKNGTWYFCYLPENGDALNVSFHELSEYFVKTLDYEDTEGIFLAYELHKATLQEHYDLSVIMKEYSERKETRDREKEEQLQRQKEYGNIFSLIEEEWEDEAAQKDEKEFYGQKKYQNSPKVDQLREERSRYPGWRKAFRHLSGRGWGQWDDLIMETDGQEESAF